MRFVGGFVAGLALLAVPVGAEVDIQYKEGRVDVRATAAPLAEVLDRLARTTGMKIVQQGVTPTMLLSLSLQGRTPAEAVFGVLEGLGLNYAFVLDASGNRIETLVLAGSAGSRARDRRYVAGAAARAQPTLCAAPVEPAARGGARPKRRCGRGGSWRGTAPGRRRGRAGPGQGGRASRRPAAACSRHPPSRFFQARPSRRARPSSPRSRSRSRRPSRQPQAKPTPQPPDR